MARLFLAVRPPPEVLDELAALPRPAEAGVRWVPPEQWHITLRFLGDAETGEVIRALEVQMPVLRALDPVEAVVGPSVSRLGRHVLCVPVAGLEELASVVSGATAELGEPVDPRPFNGHLTMGRLRGRAACGLAGHPVQSRFVVDEVELVSSVLDHEGARHEVVRAFPLGT